MEVHVAILSGVRSGMLLRTFVARDETTLKYELISYFRESYDASLMRNGVRLPDNRSANPDDYLLFYKEQTKINIEYMKSELK